MPKFQDVLIEAMKREGVEKMFLVNRGLMEIACSTKKKPGFIKVAVDDESARNFMNGRKWQSFILCFDGDMLNEIADELNEKEKDQGEAS